MLEKAPNQREDHEILHVTELLKGIQFFKEANLKEQDLNELVQSAFHFQRYQAGEAPVVYGEEGNSLFIIIKGTVSVIVPHPHIKNFKARW